MARREIKLKMHALNAFELNGVVIHENVELTGPTRAAEYEDEVSSAPLMIQGDHGPVAFRNIKYRMFRPESIKLSDIYLAYYEGAFNHQMPDLASLEIISEGIREGITSEDAAVEKQFALKYNGILEVPISGEYTFEVAHTSRVRLTINGTEVVTEQSERVNGLREFPRNAGRIELQKGEYSFELIYAKGLWHGDPTVLGFFASGPGLMRAELTEPGSIPHDAYSAYQVSPGDEPWLQRNFVPHKGEKRTHAISVGYSSGINYSYDLSRAALLNVWKGPFVDTSSMWYQRGNMQSALPLGSVIERSGMPTIGYLKDENESWPDSLENYEFKLYELNESGEPTFVYSIGPLLVYDHFTPDESSNLLIRTLSVEGVQANTWMLLAESDVIEKLKSGLYTIDDQRMFVTIEDRFNPLIREDNGVQQLILPLSQGSASIKYSIVW